VPVQVRPPAPTFAPLDGFDGKLAAPKDAVPEKTPPDTALRDITDLVGRGILKKDERGGRSTSYSLVER
jgi:Fic family protein